MAEFQLPPVRTHTVVPARITPSARHASGPGDARALLRMQSTAGNQAVQRLLTGQAKLPAVTIQRMYKPLPIEQRDFNDLIPKKWPGITVEGAKGLVTKWCKSHAQFLSLVNNASWAQFQAVTKKYASGDQVPVKWGDIKAKMDKEMKAELALLWTQQVEHYRLTGKAGHDMNYTKYLEQGILTLTHAWTFRTDAEKAEAKGIAKVRSPYTRNFSARINGAPALWEIHVHYSVDSQGAHHTQKAHAKLIAKRHEPEQVAGFITTGPVVDACTAAVNSAHDDTARAGPSW